MGRLDHAWRSLISKLGLGRFRAPFDLPAEMHEREQYSVLFIYTDTRFYRLVPEVAEWFKRRRIIYRLDTKRIQWAPTPVFTRQCDLNAFLELHTTMTRQYRVLNCMPEVTAWLEENNILHVWNPGEVTSTSYNYGLIPPRKPPHTFRLLEARDAVHLALLFDVRGKADAIRADLAARRNAAMLAGMNYPQTLSMRDEDFYRDQYFVRASS